MLATISSTKGTEGNVQTVGWTFSHIMSPWTRKLLRMGSPILCITKPKSNQVHFLSESRNLNKQLKQKQYPMPKISEMLFKLECF